MSNLIVLIVAMCCLISGIESSAIPMWEFLSKQEKTSYLYSMFANQVEEFCEKSTAMPNCNQELLKYGLNKLKSMPEDHLDNMDPYQRGANNIIWNSMMEGHTMLKATTTKSPERLPLTTTTTIRTKTNSYDNIDDFVDNDYGSQAEETAKIDNVYRVLPPKDFVYKIDKPQYYYHPNSNNLYNQNQRFLPNNNNNNRRNGAVGGTVKPLLIDHTSNNNLYLTDGPMVVKVYPDGRPVYEQYQPTVPEDEDLRQYKLSKIKLPNY